MEVWNAMNAIIRGLDKSKNRSEVAVALRRLVQKLFIYSIWRNIRNITGFGIEARFFELGKDAIKAIKAVSKLWRKLIIEIIRIEGTEQRILLDETKYVNGYILVARNIIRKLLSQIY